MTIAAEADFPTPVVDVLPPGKLAEEHCDIQDCDRDSMHTLPLAVVPLKAGALGSSRMIKNARLESVIELFEDEKSGSGQIAVGSIQQVYTSISNEDAKMLTELAKLHSYDVYSLRIELRKLGINVNEEEHLKLSEAKQAQLHRYMTAFTQRVIVEVFGDSNAEVQNYNDIVELFRHPDKRQAISKLRMMSDKLGIELEEVPVFLEDFGDIYLSIAYFRECWESVQSSFSDFCHSVDDIMENHTLKQDRNLMEACDAIYDKLAGMNSDAAERFHDFEGQTTKMWDNIDAKRFKWFKGIVRDNHAAIGGALCNLSVKMNAWNKQFPHQNAGGPIKRAEFIRLTMRQGL
jgi:hypothetical protein